MFTLEFCTNLYQSFSDVAVASAGLLDSPQTLWPVRSNGSEMHESGLTGVVYDHTHYQLAEGFVYLALGDSAYNEAVDIRFQACFFSFNIETWAARACFERVFFRALGRVWLRSEPGKTRCNR